MYRNIYIELLKWKESEVRKPLLLQGARQVGKTYIVKQFGVKEYLNLAYLNFEQTPELLQLFEGNLIPEKILENISFYLGEKITVNTLIFFDEIQVSPRAMTCLKYFQEQAPEYHVIAAGSLLGVSVGKGNSFPVGKVNFLKMHPMSFSEYLIAVGEEFVLEKLKVNDFDSKIPEPVHTKLIDHFKKYLFIGGMPEALNSYRKNRDIAAVRKIQNDILKSYERDFSKYTTKPQAIKTSEVWHSLPKQLSKENKKFKYSDVKKKARAAHYELTIEWLKNAGLVNIAYNISVPKLPLIGYVDESKFKMYNLDTGILGAMLNISSDIITTPGRLFTEYNGAFIENFVAMEMVAMGAEELYYWTSGNKAEIDFVIQKGDKILPVEVKSGMNRNKKSLQSYISKYTPDLAFRISPRNFTKDDNFINIPLYSTFLLATREF